MNTYGTVVIFFFSFCGCFFLFNLIDYTVTCNSLEWEKINKFFCCCFSVKRVNKVQHL